MSCFHIESAFKSSIKGTYANYEVAFEADLPLPKVYAYYNRLLRFILLLTIQHHLTQLFIIPFKICFKIALMQRDKSIKVGDEFHLTHFHLEAYLCYL